MKWLFIALALCAPLPALAQGAAKPATAMTPTPDDRAKQWLTLVDDSNYADAWKQAGAMLRSKADQQKFTRDVSGTRVPLGAMSSRTIKNVTLAKTLPGMRDGQYAVVKFDSAFAHKVAAVETVTLVSENGGWSVIGYFIN